MTLEREIQEAREAAAQVAELDATREKAEALPDLMARKRAEEREEAARDRLRSAAGQSRGILAEAAPKVADWRGRYEAVALELAELIEELPRLQENIMTAAHILATAAQALEEARVPAGYYDSHAIRAREQSHELPAELRPLAGGIEGLWTEIGGTDPALEALPPAVDPNSLEGEVVTLITKRARGLLYRPSQAMLFLRTMGA